MKWTPKTQAGTLQIEELGGERRWCCTFSEIFGWFGVKVCFALGQRNFVYAHFGLNSNLYAQNSNTFTPKTQIQINLVLHRRLRVDCGEMVNSIFT